MTIEIQMLTLGIVATNCYIVGDTESQQAVVIDPVDNAPLIMETAQASGWTIKAIAVTHGHYDHVLASHDLKMATRALFYIHGRTPQLAGITEPFIAQLFPPVPQPDHTLTDTDDTFSVGAITLHTLFTPGHSPDHVCFYLPSHQLVFGGDCLFAGSIGRTDLPFAHHTTLMTSIFNRLMPLGDTVQVLPGHGPATTIGQERRSNPFLLSYRPN